MAGTGICALSAFERMATTLSDYFGGNMRFKLTTRTEWHRWFAWKPVRIPETKYDSVRVPKMCVWLEVVERKRAHDSDEKNKFISALTGARHPIGLFRTYVYRLRTDGVNV